MKGNDTFLIQGPVNDTLINKVNERWRKNSQTGAAAWFAGIVRADEVDGCRVTEIEYSAHEAMAEKELHNIADEVREETGAVEVFILHSLGMVPAGSCPMLVGVAGKHRREVFNALEITVEKIKSRVPVFGKEITDGKSYRWKENS